MICSELPEGPATACIDRSRLIALLLCTCAILGCDGERPSVQSSAPARIAVYADDGTWAPSTQSIARALEEEGLSVRLLRAREIRQGALAEADALVVPGGNAWVQWQTLGDPGLEAIREFVQGGHAYVGVCAGAYLAMDEVVWEEEDTTDYPLDLIEGVARGALDEIAPWPRVSSTRLVLTGAGRERGLSWAVEEEFFYQGGPAFSGLQDAVVLATYPLGEPAIVTSIHGRGRVTLTAVHFERPAGASNDAPPPRAAGAMLRALLDL